MIRVPAENGEPDGGRSGREGGRGRSQKRGRGLSWDREDPVLVGET